MSLRTLGAGAPLIVAALAAVAAFQDAQTTAVYASPVSSALDLVYRCDELARPFLALLAVVTGAVALWNVNRPVRENALIATFAACMGGVLLARSVAAFALSWELMALSSAVLVGTYHTIRSVRRALFSYVFVSQLGFVAILGALALLGGATGSYHFEAMARSAPLLPASIRSWAVALALVGFGSKAGLVPLHFWLPRAHPAAPAGASALLSGVMLNIAIFGLLVVLLELAMPVPAHWGIVIVVLGIVSAVLGALFAAVESDLKRLLAYSSIENTGIVVMAIGIAIVARSANVPAIAGLAILAALFHALVHGFFKSLLFLGAGSVAHAAGTTDLEHLGGLARLLPFTTIAFVAGAMAAVALPPSGGFASEWLLFRAFICGIGAPAPILRYASLAATAALALAGGLGAVAFGKALGIGFLGARRSTHTPQSERFDARTASLAFLSVAVCIAGVLPMVVLRPLMHVASLLGAPPAQVGNIATLPVLVATLPVLGAIASVAVAKIRAIRTVPTWGCGSPIASRNQYTAAAFASPVRRVFGLATAEAGERDLARLAAAAVQRAARRLRIVQSGLLRVYLVYAAAAVLAVLVLAK